jgi:hypothetical protein
VRRWAPLLLLALALAAWVACHGVRVPVTSPASPPTWFEPYRREAWGSWTDADHDCQDTRAEVLIAEALGPVEFVDARHCHVGRGRWRCPYTGRVVVDPRELDIDHLVPLAEAHASGGSKWSSERRRRYANDVQHPEHLVAVVRGANRSKGSAGPTHGFRWNGPFGAGTRDRGAKLSDGGDCR